jgi:hypothetical protein
LRQLARHADAACLASLQQTAAFCKEQSAAYTWDPWAANTAAAALLATVNGQLQPADQLTANSTQRAWRQQSLSKALDKAAHSTHYSTLDLAGKASLNSETLQGASAWLEALPDPNLGLQFDAAEFRVELQKRLQVPVLPTDRPCPCCGGVMDTQGRHAGLCPAAGDRTLRHNAARNLVGRFAASAGFATQLERPGLLPAPADSHHANARRPADVYVSSWHQGPLPLWTSR